VHVATRASRRAWPWLVFGGAVIAALGGRLWISSTTKQPLPVLADVPPFALMDQTGAPFGSKDLSGKVWIASFVYTTCPGPCPRVVERLAHTQSRLGNEPDLAIVSFSVDPAADTPDVLATYGKLRNIDPRRWRLLTGPVADVVKLIRQGFLLALERAEDGNAAELALEGPVIHSTRLVLVDQRFRIRGYYETTDPGDMDRLVEDTRRLLRSPQA